MTGRTVARNASLLVTSTVLSRLAIFGLGVAIARGLGADSFGRYGVALALATVLVALADLGATPYIAREASRARDHADAIVPTLFAAKLTFSAVTAVVVGVGAWLVLSDGDLAAAIAIVLVANLLEGLSRFVYGYFQGRERMAFEATTTIVAALARAAGGVALVATLEELVPVLLWLAFVSLVQVGVTGLRLWRTARAPARPRSQEGRHALDWRAVAAMGVMTVLVMTYLRADTVLIGWLLDERDAGWYTAAYTLMASVQIVPWMVALALTPVFARTYGRDARLFESSWHEGLKAVLLASLPLALVMSLLAGPIIERIFGAAFDPSAGALAILAWACPLAGLNVLAAAVLRGAGRERALVVVSGAGVVLNIGLNLWAIPTIGIEGAAAVTVATEIAVVVGMATIAGTRGIVPMPMLPYGRIAAALAALAAVALAARSLPVEIAAAGSLVAYAVMVVLTGVVRATDLALLRGAAARRL